MSSTHLLVLVRVVLAAVVIAVVAVALILIRRALESTSQTLATLAGALEGLQQTHLHGLEESVNAINKQFDEILSVLPGVASKAAVVAARRPS